LENLYGLKIIRFVGQKVEKFLKTEMLNSEFSNREVLKTILHYSGQAGKQRKEMAQKYPEEFQDFRKSQTLSSNAILDFTKNFLKENDISTQIICWILRKLKNSRTKLSESRKELMFTYYREFRDTALRGSQAI